VRCVACSPSSTPIHVEEARLKDLTDAEIQAQTTRFRGIIAERTDAIKQELEEVRAARHGSADATEREGLEDRFQELDARYRKTIADVLDEILPEAFAHGAEACRRLVGTTVSVTGTTWSGTWCRTTCS
jgi:preprotein translocase subunit SecA